MKLFNWQWFFPRDYLQPGVAAAIVGAAAVGAVASSSASKSAADTQADAANRATDIQNQNYQQTRGDLRPYMQGGTLAQNRLNYLLGLSPYGGGSKQTMSATTGGQMYAGGSANFSEAPTRDQLRAQLLPQYTTATGGDLYHTGYYGDQLGHYDPSVGGIVFGGGAPAQAASSTVDEAGLNAAIDAQMAKYQQQEAEAQSAAQASAQNDPAYGSLTKPFTIQDFYNNEDPGYQWQLQQGQNALQNSQAAQNGVLSGAALKDLIGYNQGMAGTAYQNAFDRWNTQNNNTYNRLSGLLGIGENAAAGSGNIGATVSGNMANSIMGAGNAQAAGAIGQANAISGGINSGMGYYMMNQYLNRGNPNAGAVAGGGDGGAASASGGAFGD